MLAYTSSANEGVILLHGLCRSKGSMEKLDTALSAAGYCVENVDYASRQAGVEALAEQVISRALKSEKLKDCTRIHFITHSLGGILVRSYFARHAEPRLGRVVMLAPPNQGSEVVDTLKTWFLFKIVNGPAGSELGTDSLSAPKRLGPVYFELGIIAGDRSINWINSYLIPGPDDGKVSVESTKVEGAKEHLLLHCTHPYIMKNKEAIAACLNFIRMGGFTIHEHRF